MERDFSSGFSKQLPSSRDETKQMCPRSQTIPTFYSPKSLSCDVSFFLILQLLSVSAQKESSEASLKAALSTAQEKSVPAIKICQLLCNVHESFPNLQPVMQELGHVGKKSRGFRPSESFTHGCGSPGRFEWQQTSLSWWPEVIPQNNPLAKCWGCTCRRIHRGELWIPAFLLLVKHTSLKVCIL